MTNIEIKQKIDQNNGLIQSLFSPNTYMLNNQVAALLAENENLQKLCTHHFVDGYCDYCYKEEPRH